MKKIVKIWMYVYIIIYAIENAYLNRRCINHIIKNKKYHINNILEIDLKKLKNTGIKYIILDFDGVISANKRIIPHEGVYNFLKDALKIFGEKNIIILSNDSNKERVTYFNRIFPKIIFKKNRYFKPYRYDLDKIMYDKNIYNYKEVIIIDDRILTGVLLSLIVGAQVKYVTNPFVDHYFNFADYKAKFLRKLDIFICKSLSLLP